MIGGGLFLWSINRAKSGKPWFFSRLMQEVIPFNRPHGISVVDLSSSKCKVYLPNKRKNKNHLGTMHACAIATAAEYVSGLNVVQAFDMGKYRLIMSRIEVDYIRRPVGFCNAESGISSEQMSQINRELDADGVSSFHLISNVIDSQNEKIAKATIHWQVKSWQKVRVK